MVLKHITRALTGGHYVVKRLLGGCYGILEGILDGSQRGCYQVVVR